MTAINVKAAPGRTVPFPDGRRLPVVAGDPSAAADGSIAVDGASLFVQRCLMMGDLVDVAEPPPAAGAPVPDAGYNSDPDGEV